MMMSVMSLLILMSEYIVSANNIFLELKGNLALFEKEARLIDEAKCYLVNYKNLDNFEYENAYIYANNDTYYIEYQDLNIRLKTKDGMIIDYSYE